MGKRGGGGTHVAMDGDVNVVVAGLAAQVLLEVTHVGEQQLAAAVEVAVDRRLSSQTWITISSPALPPPAPPPPRRAAAPPSAAPPSAAPPAAARLLGVARADGGADARAAGGRLPVPFPTSLLLPPSFSADEPRNARAAATRCDRRSSDGRGARRALSSGGSGGNNEGGGRRRRLVVRAHRGGGDLRQSERIDERRGGRVLPRRRARS